MINEYRIQTYELSSSNIFWTSQISEVFEKKFFFFEKKRSIIDGANFYISFKI